MSLFPFSFCFDNQQRGLSGRCVGASREQGGSSPSFSRSFTDWEVEEVQCLLQVSPPMPRRFDAFEGD